MADTLTPPIYKNNHGDPHSVGELLASATQRFGVNPQNYAGVGHNGWDWGCVVGTNVYAMHDGVSKLVKKGFTGYGTYMTVTGSGFETTYAHLSNVVKEGPVKAGDHIGESGNTGNSTGPHLHVTCKRINNQGVILPSQPGFDGAVDFSPLLVWRPEGIIGGMSADEVKKIYVLAFYREPDSSELAYWSGKPLAQFLAEAIKDRAAFLHTHE